MTCILMRKTVFASAFKRKQFETKTLRNGTCSHACGLRQALLIKKIGDTMCRKNGDF